MLPTFRLVLFLALAACAGAAEPGDLQQSPPAVTSVLPAGATTTDRSPSSSALPPGAFVNPLIDADFPDPSVLRVGEVYYAYATNTGDTHIQVARSEDLVHWEWLGDALPVLPDWALQTNGWTWAPDVAGPFPSQDFVMYYTTRFAIGTDGTQCIGVATAQEPQGPFSPLGDAPLICFTSEGGALDADRFGDEDGKSFLVWKSDGLDGEWQSGIFIQPLSEDGLQLEGEATWLMSYDLPWEGALVEGPVLWKYEDTYYLFYSANDTNSTRYAVGVATAKDPLGPYQKLGDPILKTDLKTGIVSPGGQDLIRTPSGETWIFFHSQAAGGYRRLNLARVEWIDGRPVVGELSQGPVGGP